VGTVKAETPQIGRETANLTNPHQSMCSPPWRCGEMLGRSGGLRASGPGEAWAWALGSCSCVTQIGEEPRITKLRAHRIFVLHGVRARVRAFPEPRRSLCVASARWPGTIACPRRGVRSSSCSSNPLFPKYESGKIGPSGCRGPPGDGVLCRDGSPVQLGSRPDADVGSDDVGTSARYYKSDRGYLISSVRGRFIV